MGLGKPKLTPDILEIALENLRAKHHLHAFSLPSHGDEFRLCQELEVMRHRRSADSVRLAQS